MLKDRLRSGVALGAALLAAMLFLPPVGGLLVLLLLCGIATWEFYALADRAKLPSFRVVGLAGGLALVGVTWYQLWAGQDACANADGLVLFLVVTALFVRQFPQKHNDRPLQTISTTLLGVMYVPFLLNFITKLLMTWGFDDGRLLVLYMIVVVKFTDMGAYFIGCSIGRHKLFPRISPAKSWEGTLGGVATGLLASVVYYFITRDHWAVLSVHIADVVVLGVLLAVCGVVGDLAESLLKRAAGAKDSGVLFQGMGGLLDLLDSLLFAAPVMFVYTRLFMAPNLPL